MDDFEAALEQFRLIANDLGNGSEDMGSGVFFDGNIREGALLFNLALFESMEQTTCSLLP